MSTALIPALLLVVLVPGQAHALYLDPGTGSLVIQIVVAGALTAWFSLKGHWEGLRSKVNKLLHRSDETPDDK